MGLEFMSLTIGTRFYHVFKSSLLCMERAGSSEIWKEVALLHLEIQKKLFNVLQACGRDAHIGSFLGT